MPDQLIQFPPEQVIEANNTILANGRGLRGGVNHAALGGALARIDNAIVYSGLEDVYCIAAKYAKAIAQAHAFADANKRTGLAVCLDYLEFNDIDLNAWRQHDALAYAMVHLVTGEISEDDFADSLYTLNALAEYERTADLNDRGRLEAWLENMRERYQLDEEEYARQAAGIRP